MALINKLILFSGGVDSTTLLHLYKENIKIAISFNYGSKHNAVEIKHAKKICKELGIKHKVIDLPFINQYFKSNLLKSGGKIPNGHYQDKKMRSTVVPFRNGIMLSITAGIAESENCKEVLIANHYGDHAIYPDCRSEFIISMSEAISNGTYNKIKINAPFTLLTKRQIALKGKTLNVDYSKTYSCYNGKTIHCGTCATCVERKEALDGFDNTKYLK